MMRCGSSHHRTQQSSRRTVSEVIEDWSADGAASEQQWFEEQPATGSDGEQAWG